LIAKYFDPQSAINFSGSSERPVNFELLQNYPNPFNPSTIIRFNINNASAVSIKVFDITGKEVADLVNGFLEAGSHKIEFQAKDIPSGVYFYRAEARDNISREPNVRTKQMILIK